MEYLEEKHKERTALQEASPVTCQKFPSFLSFNSLWSLVIRISRLTDWTGHENDKKPRFEYLRSGG